MVTYVDQTLSTKSMLLELNISRFYPKVSINRFYQIECAGRSVEFPTKGKLIKAVNKKNLFTRDKYSTTVE